MRPVTRLIKAADFEPQTPPSRTAPFSTLEPLEQTVRGVPILNLIPPIHLRVALPLHGLDRLSCLRAPYIYRLYDSSGVVVYVGVSELLKSRLKCHSHRFVRNGWDLVGFEADLMPTRAAAEALEVELIEALRPIRNIAVGPTHRWVRL